MNAKKMKMIRRAARALAPDGERSAYYAVNAKQSEESRKRKGQRRVIMLQHERQKAIIKRLKRETT